MLVKGVPIVRHAHFEMLWQSNGYKWGNELQELQRKEVTTKETVPHNYILKDILCIFTT